MATREKTESEVYELVAYFFRAAEYASEDPHTEQTGTLQLTIRLHGRRVQGQIELIEGGIGGLPPDLTF